MLFVRTKMYAVISGRLSTVPPTILTPFLRRIPLPVSILHRTLILAGLSRPGLTPCGAFPPGQIRPGPIRISSSSTLIRV